MPGLLSCWNHLLSAEHPVGESGLGSSYNALLLGFRHRFASGFEFGTAYTWSKSLDNGDTMNASAAANAPGLVMNITLAEPDGRAVAELKTIRFGVLKFAWFAMLNASPRNCSASLPPVAGGGEIHRVI